MYTETPDEKTCIRQNNAKLLLDVENSVKRKRVYGIDSHCNGRIKVSTLRYLRTFHPAVRIRLIYLFIYLFFCSSPFLPPPPLCWFVAAGRWRGRGRIFLVNGSSHENKSKTGGKFANVCRKTFRRISAENTCWSASIDDRGRGIIKSTCVTFEIWFIRLRDLRRRLIGGPLSLLCIARLLRWTIFSNLACV